MCTAALRRSNDVGDCRLHFRTKRDDAEDNAEVLEEGSKGSSRIRTLQIPHELRSVPSRWRAKPAAINFACKPKRVAT